MKANKNIFFAAVLAALAAGVMSCPGTSEEPPAKRLVGISVTPPAKVVYNQYESYKEAGLAVTANYDDGSKTSVTEDFTVRWEGETLADNTRGITEKDGDKTVNVEWSGKKASFTVKVAAAEVLTVVDAAAWDNALLKISTGGDNKSYVINITGNFGVTPLASGANTFGEAKNIIVILQSRGEYTLSECCIRLGDTQTLRLEGYPGLTGDKKNTIVSVNSGAVFIMNGGTIKDNSGLPGGSGVDVNGGSFTMNAGTISGIKQHSGVRISSGTFIMTGGTITNNTNHYGSGVFVDKDGTFTMTGGSISGNSTYDNNASKAGGVYVSGGRFIMNGGIVNDNHAVGSNGNGGGVFVDNNGIFTMNEGTISGNKGKMGGGVFITTSATFTMSGGTISGNEAESGGGVYATPVGNFIKKNGEIFDNKASLGDTNGHAVGFGSYYRDDPLQENDNISTADPLPEESGDTVGNWTRG